MTEIKEELINELLDENNNLDDDSSLKKVDEIIQTEQEAEKTKPKRNHYTNDDERHVAILKAKRDYYHRNHDLFKLKSRRRYYNTRINLTDISDEKRNKYNTKITELNDQIKAFNSSEEK